MSDSEVISVSRFSTDRFAPRDRFEAWANRDWPAIGMLFDAAPAGDFYNRAVRFALGRLEIHVSDMAAQRYRRPRARYGATVATRC